LERYLSFAVESAADQRSTKYRGLLATFD